jgi:hypothetical protein
MRFFLLPDRLLRVLVMLATLNFLIIVSRTEEFGLGIPGNGRILWLQTSATAPSN